jgi:hypothetical protein
MIEKPFRRIFTEIAPEGFVAVVFNADATSASVLWAGAVVHPDTRADEAVRLADALATKKRSDLAAYLWRRDQWNASWGILT